MKKDWSEYIMKKQAFLATKECVEQSFEKFKTKLPSKETDALDLIADEKSETWSKDEEFHFNGIYHYYSEWYSKINAIYTVQAKDGWMNGKACMLFQVQDEKFNPGYHVARLEEMFWEL